LLCSDGLSDLVGKEAIGSVLKTPNSDQQQVDTLVEMALNAGGIDNITAIIVSAPEFITPNSSDTESPDVVEDNTQVPGPTHQSQQNAPTTSPQNDATIIPQQLELPRIDGHITALKEKVLSCRHASAAQNSHPTNSETRRPIETNSLPALLRAIREKLGHSPFLLGSLTIIVSMMLILGATTKS
jgi:hypothetical protein